MPLVPFLSQFILLCIFPSHLFNIYFSIIFPCMPRSSKWFLTFEFLYLNHRPVYVGLGAGKVMLGQVFLLLLACHYYLPSASYTVMYYQDCIILELTVLKLHRKIMHNNMGFFFCFCFFFFFFVFLFFVNLYPTAFKLFFVLLVWSFLHWACLTMRLKINVYKL